MAIAVFEKLWAIPILVLVLASVLVAYSASATEVFQDTEKTIMNSTIKAVSSPIYTFQVSGVTPYYHTGIVFNATYNVEVNWDQRAVSSAFIPAILEIYKIYNNSNINDGYVISKRPSLLGYVAIFRGGHTESNAGPFYCINDYKLSNGNLYFRVAYSEAYKTYSERVILSVEDEYQAKVEAWAALRAGISAELKLLDFVNAGINLVEAELGVSTSISYTRTESSQYIYTVNFTIPTYKVDVVYQAKAEIYHEYTCVQRPGVPTPLYGTEPIQGTETLLLNANDAFAYYTDILYISPTLAYEEFNAGNTTGILVFG